MNGKRLISLFLVLYFTMNVSGICYGKDKKTPLSVKSIVFTPDKSGGERVTLLCNQRCAAEIFSLEEENLRVVLDMMGVSMLRTKARNVNTGGRLVRNIRSSLNNQTNILRVVLDMEPSKYYIVRPMQDPSSKYTLTIKEDASSSRLRKKRITILGPDPSQEEQRGSLQGATSSPEKRSAMNAELDVPLLEQGKSQLLEGEFAAAVDTFTQILVDHPDFSMVYRLRGDAYDNLDDQENAMEDWKQAARLGDTVLQSYLDSLKVKWRGKLAP